MFQKYMTIGELAKMKGVSIKALRYYDKIGVLKPAYVNPETGYRYYLPEQMMIVDLIRLCLTFQLPLQILKDLGREKSPDLQALMLRGQQQARQKLEEAKKVLQLSENITEQIDRLNHSYAEGESYQTHFPERYFLLSPWKLQKNAANRYIDQIGKLQQKAGEEGMTVLAQQGLFMNLQSGEEWVFLEVDGADNHPEMLKLEEGDYTCMILQENKLSQLPAILNEKKIDPAFVLCLNTDIFDYCLQHHLHQFEVQYQE